MNEAKIVFISSGRMQLWGGRGTSALLEPMPLAQRGPAVRDNATSRRSRRPYRCHQQRASMLVSRTRRSHNVVGRNFISASADRLCGGKIPVSIRPRFQ